MRNNSAEIIGHGGESLPPPRMVTIRAVCIACALMPAIALWVVLCEMVWFANHPTALSLFFHVTAILFFIAVLNVAVEKWWPRHALTPGELVTIYMMLSVASVFCSHDFMQTLIPLLFHPQHVVNPGNNWQTLVLDRAPAWALVRGHGEAVTGAALGNSSLYSWEVLSAWLGPFAFWGTFIAALVGALLTLNVFFRKQWTEREKLSFPVIQIPLMVATRMRDLLGSRVFWIAFGIAGGIDVVNGLNFYYPLVPKIPNIPMLVFSDYLQEPPWNAIGFVRFNVLPFIIGIVFFIPADLAFSCWFFYVFSKLMLVLGAATGMNAIPGFPFEKEQSGGGYLALGLLAIWLARGHLVMVAKTILGRPGGYDETGEPMRYRTAAAVFLVSTVTLVVFGCLLGASWYVMVAFFAIFFLYSIAIARMRAELGPPAHDLYAMGPDVMIHNAVGTRDLGDGNLMAFTMLYWFNRSYRSHFSAHCIEGFKLAQLRRITARSMMVAMLIAVVVGTISGVWAILHTFHVHGYSAGAGMGYYLSAETWNRYVSWTTLPRRADLAATLATGFGAVSILCLGALRMRFTWWAWHPVGYITANSWTMDNIWFCMFLGWLAKAVVVRYGGARLYRKAEPFFAGLVLGEFVIMTIWSIIGVATGTGGYRFMY